MTFGTMTNILIPNVNAKRFKFSKCLDSLDSPTTDQKPINPVVPS